MLDVKDLSVEQRTKDKIANTLEIAMAISFIIWEGIMKEFNMTDRIEFPSYTVTKLIEDLYIVFAPKYPNWIVLDRYEHKLYEYLLNNTIVDSMIKLRDQDKVEESIVVSIANKVLYKIEDTKFYKNTKIQQEDAMSEITKTIHFNITNDCNLRCKHCYMSAGVNDKKELSKEKVLSFLNEITNRNGSTEVVISGGEPLIHKDVYKIIEGCKKLNHKVILFTNGLLIDEGNIEFIKNNVDEIQISMEGISLNYYEIIRGVGTYEKLIESLILIRDKEIPITLAITVLDNVINDISENLISFLDSMNFKNINVRVNDAIEMKGNMIKNSYLLDSSSHQKKTMVIDIVRKLKENGYSVDRAKERNIHFSNCGIGTSINVDYDGKVYPCNEFDCKFFDIESCASNIINEFNLLNETTSIKFMDMCKECDIKLICNGGCRIKNLLSTGSYIKATCSEEYKEKKYYDLLIDYLMGE